MKPDIETGHEPDTGQSEFPAGFCIVHDKQRYWPLRVRKHVWPGGAEIEVIDWRTNCPTCGVSFVVFVANWDVEVQPNHRPETNATRHYLSVEARGIFRRDNRAIAPSTKRQSRTSLFMSSRRCRNEPYTPDGGTMRFWIIYAITSPTPGADRGKQYVGQCKADRNGSSRDRWRRHITKAMEGDAKPLFAAIRQYGPDAFVVEEVACALSLTVTLAIEKAMLARFGTLHPFGFNVQWSILDRRRADPDMHRAVHQIGNGNRWARSGEKERRAALFADAAFHEPALGEVAAGSTARHIQDSHDPRSRAKRSILKKGGRRHVAGTNRRPRRRSRSCASRAMTYLAAAWPDDAAPLMATAAAGALVDLLQSSVGQRLADVINQQWQATPFEIVRRKAN